MQPRVSNHAKMSRKRVLTIALLSEGCSDQSCDAYYDRGSLRYDVPGTLRPLPLTHLSCCPLFRTPAVSSPVTPRFPISAFATLVSPATTRACLSPSHRMPRDATRRKRCPAPSVRAKQLHSPYSRAAWFRVHHTAHGHHRAFRAISPVEARWRSRRTRTSRLISRNSRPHAHDLCCAAVDIALDLALSSSRRECAVSLYAQGTHAADPG